MRKELAEGILALDFPEADVVRADELIAKANDGTLTEDEQVELEAYVGIPTYSRTGSRVSRFRQLKGLLRPRARK